LTNKYVLYVVQLLGTMISYGQSCKCKFSDVEKEDFEK